MSKQRLHGRGWLAGTRVVVLLVIGILWALPATARDRHVVLIGTVDPPRIDSETGLFVGDVERLHDVLDKLSNDPAALGLASSSATIQLAANVIYRLDPSKPEEGRVRLALGTEIRGRNQYTDDRDEDGNPGPDGIPDAIGVDAMGNEILRARRRSRREGLDRRARGDRSRPRELHPQPHSLGGQGSGPRRDTNRPGARSDFCSQTRTMWGASRLTASSAKRGGGASRSLVRTGPKCTSRRAGALSATTRTPWISRSESRSPPEISGSGSRQRFAIAGCLITG